MDRFDLDLYITHWYGLIWFGAISHMLMWIDLTLTYISPVDVDWLDRVPGHVEWDGLCVLLHNVFLGQEFVYRRRACPQGHTDGSHQVQGHLDETLERLLLLCVLYQKKIISVTHVSTIVAILDLKYANVTIKFSYICKSDNKVCQPPEANIVG